MGDPNLGVEWSPLGFPRSFPLHDPPKPVSFLLPWAVALLVPAVWAWWRFLRNGPGARLRALVLGLLVLAACGPVWENGHGGSDVILVLDRSSSLGDLRARQGEYLRRAAEQRRQGDRLGVVLVGRGSAVIQAPQEDGIPEGFGTPIPEDASDLGRGLASARALLPPGRTGRVVLISDGEDTGPDARAQAAALALGGIPLDVLGESLPGSADRAVLGVELPASLRLGESFLGAARLLSDRAESRTWKIRRGETVLAEGTAELLPGQPVTVTFADRPPRARLTEYTVELDAADDARPANNKARAALRVSGGEPVLVVGGDGSPGSLTNALTAAGLRVRTRAEGPLSLSDLAGVQALVLEQVPADRLGGAGLEAVADWVEHLGGGLVLTGGRRSFGVGGYHKSAVERVLPVTMEIRDEHRKMAVAMAITLDRSGSMGVSIGGGRTKMDLADEGACAAIGLLGPRDQVAVHAVDSEPYIIIPLSPVTDPQGMIRKVRGIRSQGGGIYVCTALEAAGAELLRSTSGTRHLVLFADANDAEEPGSYRTLLAKYRAAGITVSVVAMGTPQDSDAEFLKDVAKLGGGRISFAEKVDDLPRLFAQETLLIARTAWVDQATTVVRRPGLDLLLPRFGHDPWPTVAGFNLTYPRERAQVHAWLPGDPEGPALASWRIGTGRSIALPLAADAPALTAWPGYAPLMSGLVRWAAGEGTATPGTLSAERVGRSAVLTLELDPEQADAVVEPGVALVDADGRPAGRAAWERTGPLTWRARVDLDERVILPAAQVAGSAVIGPALCLPYPAEAAPRLGLPTGERILAGLAAAGGGKVRSDLTRLFANPPSPGLPVPWLPWLLTTALALLVGEIAWRRTGGIPLPSMRWPARWTWRTSWPRRRTTAPVVPSPGNPPASLPATVATTAPPPGATPPDTGQGLSSALDQLKQRRPRR